MMLIEDNAKQYVVKDKFDDACKYVSEQINDLKNVEMARKN